MLVTLGPALPTQSHLRLPPLRDPPLVEDFVCPSPWTQPSWVYATAQQSQLILHHNSPTSSQESWLSPPYLPFENTLPPTPVPSCFSWFYLPSILSPLAPSLPDLNVGKPQTSVSRLLFLCSWDIWSIPTTWTSPTPSNSQIYIFSSHLPELQTHYPAAYLSCPLGSLYLTLDPRELAVHP